MLALLVCFNESSASDERCNKKKYAYIYGQQRREKAVLACLLAS